VRRREQRQGAARRRAIIGDTDEYHASRMVGEGYGRLLQRFFAGSGLELDMVVLVRELARERVERPA
jgi:hypothetical protein